MKLRFACLLVSLMCLGCGARSDATKPSAAEMSSTPATVSASAAASPTADNNVKLSIVSYDQILERVAAQRGKVVVMDAWSTSCPPCMKEFPHLVELHKKHPADKLACISLSFDFEGLGTPEERVEPVLAFLKQQQATFENLMSNEESDVLYRKFKLAAVPAVFVYDQSGQLRKRFDNERAKTKEEAFTYAQVAALVEELLAEPPQEAAAKE